MRTGLAPHPGAAECRLRADRSTATCSICRTEAPRLIDAAVETGADLVVGERQFDRDAMPVVALLRQRHRQPRAVVVHGRAAARHAVRLSAVSRRHASPAARCARPATTSKPRCWSRSAAWAAGSSRSRSPRCMAARPSKLRPVRDTTRTCFRAVYYRYLERVVTASSPASPTPCATGRLGVTPARGCGAGHRRSTTGVIFGLTVRGVRRAAARSVVRRSATSARGSRGALHARYQRGASRTTCAPVLPDDTETRASTRCVDRPIAATRATRSTFSARCRHHPKNCAGRSTWAGRPRDLRQRAARWPRRPARHRPLRELGDRRPADGRVVNLPLTIVAMAEADPEVNRLRQDTRARMGIETLEVRQSLDTALQIRRMLGRKSLRRAADRSASRPRPRRRSRSSDVTRGFCRPPRCSPT